MRLLYLTLIPYRAQHLIFTATQHLLEECCFDFAMKWLPDVLKEHMWDCPEAVELNRWIRVLLKHSGSLPQHAFENDSGLSLRTVLSSVIMLRHSAVHRLQISTARIAQMVRSAAKVANVLGDRHRAMQLTVLQQETQAQSDKLEIWTDHIRKRFSGELQGVSERRAELDRMEAQAKVAFIQEDNNNKSLIGSFFEESIANILRSHKVLEEHSGSQPDAQEKKAGITWKDISFARDDTWSARKSGPDLLASNRPSRDAMSVDERSSDEFSCDDATYEALRLAAESEKLMDA